MTHRRFDRTARLLGDDGHRAARALDGHRVRRRRRRLVRGRGARAQRRRPRDPRRLRSDLRHQREPPAPRDEGHARQVQGRGDGRAAAARSIPTRSIEARAEFYSAGDLGAAARARARRRDRRDRQHRGEDAPDRDVRARSSCASCRRWVRRRGSIRRRSASPISRETRVDPFARDLRRNLRRKHDLDCTQPRRRVGGVLRGDADRAAARSPTTTARSSACARAARTASTTASTRTASRARSRSCRRCSA